MAQQILSTNTFTTAKWIVSATASDGTHTTIGAALTSASSGDYIFIRPGTYTENLTLKSGVILVGPCPNADSTPLVTIIGKMIDNGGVITTSLSNIRCQTNSDYILNMTAASAITFYGCYLYGLNNIAVTSNASGSISFYNCVCNIGTTGIGFYSGSVSIQAYNSQFPNSGGSSTASTTTSSINLINSSVSFPMTTSSSSITANNCLFDTSSQNVSCIISATAGTSNFYNCTFTSGSASAISAGASTVVNLYRSIVNSSNTNAVTGGGTVKVDDVSYIGTSVINNATTRTFATIGEYATWTPVLAFGGASTGITYVAHTGTYTRIGNVVTFTCDVELSSKGSSTGAAQITGLPYASAATTILPISASSLTFVGVVNARMTGGSGTLNLDSFATTAGRASLSDTAFGNSTFVQISGSYLV